MASYPREIKQENLEYNFSIKDRIAGVLSGVFNFAAIAVPSIVALGISVSVSPENTLPITTFIENNFALLGIAALGSAAYLGIKSGSNAARNSAINNGRATLNVFTPRL